MGAIDVGEILKPAFNSGEEVMLRKGLSKGLLHKDLALFFF